MRNPRGYYERLLAKKDKGELCFREQLFEFMAQRNVEDLGHLYYLAGAEKTGFSREEFVAQSLVEAENLHGEYLNAVIETLDLSETEAHCLSVCYGWGRRPI